MGKDHTRMEFLGYNFWGGYGPIFTQRFSNLRFAGKRLRIVSLISTFAPVKLDLFVLTMSFIKLKTLSGEADAE